MNKIRVVLDTNVLVSAFIKYGGNEWRILRKAILGEIILITSDEIIEEFESVISRPKFGYSKERVNEMKNFITSASRTVVPDERFIPKLREICDRYEILFIDDEIQAGFCRTGKMFACEHFGVVPDIMTMSKALGGVGFPISAIAYKQELDTFPPGKHIGTFRGNMIAYAGGAAGIQFMLKNELANYALELGNMMLTMLSELEQESKIIGEARGKGLMLGVEFVRDKATKEPAPELASKVRTLCHQNGLCIEIGGHYFNVARFLPPLIITEKLARKGIEIFAESVKELEKVI